MLEIITSKSALRWLTPLLVIFPLNVFATTPVNVHEEMIEALEAYADFKMGNHQEAFTAWKKLAEKGNAQGILNTAHMYLAGEGTQASCSKALKWYRRGVELGDPMAMYSLGQLYTNGEFVDEDKETGIAYFREAGAAGLIEAQQWLSEYYLSNDDHAEATYWLQRAADNGDYEASLKLKGISDSGNPTTEINGPFRLAVHNWLKTLDDAANHRDATTLTGNILPDATIKIRMPGQQVYQTLSRKELYTLWANVFSSAYRYRFTRTDYQVLPMLSGMKIKSTIRENILSDGTVRILKMEETMRARLNEDRWEISALSISVSHIP
ncbi:sel1 repeat family protein [Parasalinivibrio latis]|uniref:tetratricopeptide repeat protein n=1 Tax=Parasalinivibrio latis TaxID=2952610 RepID=UPI0030E13B02